MSRVRSQIELTPLVVFLGRSLGRAASCSLQGAAGQTLVVCLDPKGQSRGGFLMPNISAWPNVGSGSSLLQVLERTSIPERYYLSPKACAGILRRAGYQAKTLPALLQQALATQAGALSRKRHSPYGMRR